MELGKNVKWRKEGADYIVYSQITDYGCFKIFRLEKSGAFIWDGIIRNNSKEEILDSLVLNFPKQSRGRLRSDLNGFLKNLAKWGVVNLA